MSVRTVCPSGARTSSSQQLGTDGLIDLLTAAVVGRDNDSVLRLCGVVSGYSRNAFLPVGNLGDTSLAGEHVDTLLGIVLGKLLDSLQQFRVLSAA